MKKCLLILLAGVASLKGYSQQAAPATNVAAVTPVTPGSEFKATWYGFARVDYVFDTRKSAAVREDHLNLYPQPVIKDANLKDKNDAVQSNFLSVVSRLGVNFAGPNVWGAKVKGNLEGDFFGNSEISAPAASTLNSTMGLFRLRHAYSQLEWAKTTVTMGQTWYPTFIPEVYPGVANFSTGIPFNPFGWAPQLKVKQAITNEVSVIATAYKEREFGVIGSVNNDASVNSPIPTLNAQVQFKKGGLFLGAGYEYKSVIPKTEIFPSTTSGTAGTTGTTVATKATLNSQFVYAYGKFENSKIIAKVYGIQGGNLSNLVMLGGYTTAYTGTGAATTISYSPIKTTSAWVDIASAGKSIAPGIFAGYTSIDGATDAGTVSSRGNGIKNLIRVAGRVDFKQNKFRITPEVEYNTVDWGMNAAGSATSADTKGVADGVITKADNIRFTVSCVYTF